MALKERRVKGKRYRRRFVARENSEGIGKGNREKSGTKIYVGKTLAA